MNIHLLMDRFLFYFIFVIVFFSCQQTEKKISTNSNNLKIEIPSELKKLIENSTKDSNNIDLKLKIIYSFDSLGLHKEALIYIDKLITTDSLNNAFWLKRGQTCKQFEDTAAAIKAFRYAVRIYPTPIALMELANMYAETKNPLTLAICNQLIKMNPDGTYNGYANFLIGIYYSKIGDKKNAITAFDNSITEDIYFSDAYIEKGYILFNDKKYNEALKVFEQLTSINQTSANGYYWQAKCNQIINKKEEAIRLYEKALILDPSIIEAKQALDKLKK